MTSRNNITGDSISTKAASDKYRNGWDAIFGKKEKKINIIPPITDPLGAGWRQPPTEHILIDDDNATMAPWAFNQLYEYSSSIPTGVYPGKMWKCHVGVFERGIKPEDCYWELRWFGECEDPSLCTTNSRRIITTDL